MLLSFVAIVVVFGLIVAIHEFGHMLAAKACGVAVPDYALGFGPSLIHRKWGGTRFHICAFPIGGMVRIAGLEGEDSMEGRSVSNVVDLDEEKRDMESHTSDERKWGEKVWQDINGWQKSFILVAGAAMNIVLALIVVIIMGQIGFPQSAVLIAEVMDGKPAAVAGIEPGDIITEINGVAIDSSREFSSIVAERNGQPTELEVMRAGAGHLSLTVTPESDPEYNDGKPSIGVAMGDNLFLSTNKVNLVPLKTVGQEIGLKVGDVITHVNGQPIVNGYDLLFTLANYDENLNPIDDEGNPIPEGGGTPVDITVERNGETLAMVIPGDTTLASLGIRFEPKLKRLPFMEALGRSMMDAYYFGVSIIMGLKLLFTKVGISSVSGPVGIMSMIGQSAQSGWYSFLQIMMIINLAIAVFNLLPLPALDGGRIAFVALNGIGIRISERREAVIHGVGMLVLLSLIVLVSISDILAWFK